LLELRSWTDLAVARTVGWGAGLVAIQFADAKIRSGLDEKTLRLSAPSLPSVQGEVVIELGRTSFGRRGSLLWVHAVAFLSLKASLACVGLMTCPRALVPYVFEKPVDCYDSLLVDVRTRYDPSSHLLHGEPILPSAFHFAFVAEKRQKEKVLVLSNVEVPSFLLVSCGGAEVAYEVSDVGSVVGTSCSTNAILFKAEVSELSFTIDESPPTWLIEAATRATLKAASFHHPFLRFSGEFCWRSEEAFGSNWSIATLAAPGKIYSAVGLIDSVFQQVIFALPRQLCRLRMIRRILIAPNAFTFRK
jgi:hypothetical protein